MMIEATALINFNEMLRFIYLKMATMIDSNMTLVNISSDMRKAGANDLIVLSCGTDLSVDLHQYSSFSDMVALSLSSLKPSLSSTS